MGNSFIDVLCNELFVNVNYLYFWVELIRKISGGGSGLLEPVSLNAQYWCLSIPSPGVDLRAS
jgi:hypothetical protein